MNDFPDDYDQLTTELAQIRQQVVQLEQKNAVLESQRQLIENVVLMTRDCLSEEHWTTFTKKSNLIENIIHVIYSSPEEEGLQTSLQSILDTAVELTKADKGSLFLLDTQGVVIRSILTRSDPNPEERKTLIHLVLDKGLAGWVYHHQQLGLIHDTASDDRWLTLPNQPYQVRSALAVPIMRGKEVLALITLLHSEPRHFSEGIASLMEITAKQIALTLEMVAIKMAFSKERSTHSIQKQLLENLLEKAQDAQEENVLKTTLQKIVDLSADLTNAPSSSLFLLDTHGKIADAILSRREVTPQQRATLIGSVLDRGLAGWVNKHHQLGLISDTETDERWLTLPNQPYAVRSALAVPILRGDQLLGILTLLHPEVGHFTHEVADQMQMTADQIALVLENARIYSKLDQYSKALDNELKKGRQIQIDFLPYELCQLPNWEIAACFYPARQVAGDFYDCFYLPDTGQVGLVIADVCDKGVGAALFMALFRSLIRVFARQSNIRGQTSTILEKEQPLQGWVGSPPLNREHLNALQAVKLTNDYVAIIHPNLCMFATLFFGVLDPESGLFTYVNGGHEPLFILHQGEVKQTLEPTGSAVGMMPDSEFHLGQIILEPGDILFGYTDGVPEGKNEEGELFKMQRLLPILTQPTESANQLLDRIKTELFAYIGEAPQFDDITMIAVLRQETP